jgi:hypothetical protein
MSWLLADFPTFSDFFSLIVLSKQKKNLTSIEYQASQEKAR